MVIDLFYEIVITFCLAKWIQVILINSVCEAGLRAQLETGIFPREVNKTGFVPRFVAGSAVAAADTISAPWTPASSGPPPDANGSGSDTKNLDVGEISDVSQPCRRQLRTTASVVSVPFLFQLTRRPEFEGTSFSSLRLLTLRKNTTLGLVQCA